MKTTAVLLAGTALLLFGYGPAQARTRHARHHRMIHHMAVRHTTMSHTRAMHTSNAIHITGSRPAGSAAGTTTVDTSSPGTLSVNDANRDNPRAADGGSTAAGSGTNNAPMPHHRRHSVIPPAAITNNGQSSAGTGATP